MVSKGQFVGLDWNSSFESELSNDSHLILSVDSRFLAHSGLLLFLFKSCMLYL